MCCRPGRINRKVYLGHMAAPESLLLIQHYFGQLTQQQEQQLLATWVDDAVSPATLEALCAEHEEVEDLLMAVQQLMPHASQAVVRGYCAAAQLAEPEGLSTGKAVAQQRLQQQQQQLQLKRPCSAGIAIDAVSGSSAISPFVAPAAATISVTDAIS